MAEFSLNPNYLHYEKMLLQLHRLITEGKGNEEEAEAIRDEMDAPWFKLSREETERLKGLSADLYLLQDDEVFEPYEGTQEDLRQAINKAHQSRNFQSLLNLLRKGPKFIPPLGMASLRATSYQALGHLETALVFQHYALAIAKKHGMNDEKQFFETQIVELLLLLRRYEEAAAQAKDNLSTMTDPNFLCTSAVALFRCAEHFPPEGASSFYLQVAGELERLLNDIHKRNTLSPALMPLVYHVLGNCYERLGQSQKAESAYDGGLEIVNRTSSGKLYSQQLDYLDLPVAA